MWFRSIPDKLARAEKCGGGPADGVLRHRGRRGLRLLLLLVLFVLSSTSSMSITIIMSSSSSSSAAAAVVVISSAGSSDGSDSSSSIIPITNTHTITIYRGGHGGLRLLSNEIGPPGPN